jgi:hypothetical protein
MAEQPPSIQFEDVPLDQARRMGRGPRMNPELYHALKQKIQSLEDTAPGGHQPDHDEDPHPPRGHRTQHPDNRQKNPWRSALLALRGGFAQ